jgi:hypothetical protein
MIIKIHIQPREGLLFSTNNSKKICQIEIEYQLLLRCT